MKTLVIGGNRFFGKRLVHLLLEQGIEVTVLNRGQGQDDFGSRVSRIKADRRDLTAEHPATSGRKWDVIFDQVCYDASEAKGACEAFGGKVDKYIFISSQSVYDSGQALPESAFDPVNYRFDKIATKDENYAEAKRQAEATFFREATFPVLAVRFPIVLGPDDYTERLKFHVGRILEGKPIYFPNLEARISFIQSFDAARFLVHMARQDVSGPLNCSSPEPISVRALIGAIESLTGKKGVLVSHPGAYSWTERMLI